MKNECGVLSASSTLIPPMLAQKLTLWSLVDTTALLLLDILNLLPFHKTLSRILHLRGMASEPHHPTIPAGDHQAYMEYALEQARRSPPASTKFCVGAVLVDADSNTILSTGYSLELPRDSLGDPGSTHAEQCCFIKIAQKHNLPEERIGEVLSKKTVLYTTMEPCNKRLSGNRTCVERILRLKGAIGVVYVGIKEPGVFVGENLGRKRLEDAGVVVEVVEGMEERILEVSTAGHEVEGR